MPSWSHSKLVQYEKCPYILKLRTLFPQSPNAAMQRGIEKHAEIETYLNGGLLPETQFTDALVNLKKLNAQAELQWGLSPEWTPWDDFKTAWGKCVIDAFVKADDYLLIVDFKTGKPNPVSHQDQAQIYAIAAHCYYPEIEDIYTQFWYLDSGKTTQHNYRPEHTQHYKKVLQARIDKC